MDAIGWPGCCGPPAAGAYANARRAGKNQSATVHRWVIPTTRLRETGGTSVGDAFTRVVAIVGAAEVDRSQYWPDSDLRKCEAVR